MLVWSGNANFIAFIAFLLGQSVTNIFMGLILEFAMFGSLDQISLWSQRIRSFKRTDFYQSLKKVPKFS